MKRLRGLRWTAAAPAVLVLAAGCSREAASVRTLPTCSAVRVDTAGWVRTEGPYRGYSFLLPPGFRRDSSAIFMHGGVAWHDGARHLHLANGYWSPASFRGSYAPEPPRDPAYSECWTTIGGLRAFVATRHSDTLYSASAWFPDPRASTSGFRGYEIVLGGRSPSREDQALFIAIIRTVAAESAK